MGAKLITVFAGLVAAWMVTDALLHPQGVDALAKGANSLLVTVGNTTTGISTNPNAHVLGS